MPGLLLLLGGPAGAGKSTVATAWCRSRSRAVHVEIDDVRSRIVSGLADPQEPGELQTRQYAASVEASIALARAFLVRGYDVVLDDALEPSAFARYWREPIADLDYRLLVLRPELEETLRRSRSRAKAVQERHSRAQHAAAGDWGPKHVIDTTRMSADEAVRAVEARLREMEAGEPDAGPDAGSYLVRPPELEDAPALTAAWLDGGRYYAELDPEHFQVPEEDGLDGWTQRWICEDRDADSAILVAERNGAVVGYVHGSVARPQPDAARQLMRELTEPVLRVDALMVRESYRRQGAGTALMAALERWAKGRGATRVFLSTFRHSPSSVPFYRDRMGYEDKSVGLWKRL